MMVTIVYATPDVQFIQELDLPHGLTIKDAIERSQVLQLYPNISLEKNNIGIFGELVSLETKPKDKDRIEIYSPLTIDPMQARRLRERANIQK